MQILALKFILLYGKCSSLIKSPADYFLPWSIDIFNNGKTSSSIQSLGHVQLFTTPWTVACPGACSNSCPSSWWCHLTISSSVIPFCFCLQSFPASGSFPVSRFSTSGGQSTRASVSISALPMNIQDWSPLGWTDWISLQSKGLWVFSNTTVQKHQSFCTQLSL